MRPAPHNDPGTAGPDAASLMEPALNRLVSARTGPLLDEQPSRHGHRADYTGTVTTQAGPVFIKAVRVPGPQAASIQREAAVSSDVAAVSPALLWQDRGHGWHVLCFRHVPGRRASFKPGSPDIPLAADLIERAGELPLPAAASGEAWRERRYDRYAPGQAGLFRGRALLHGDITPDNIIVGTDGRAWLVDWGWPASGAGFLDFGGFVVQLIAAGHDPGEAEGFVSGAMAWKEASPQALLAFSRALLFLYKAFEDRHPAEEWREKLTGAAWLWHEHRRAA